jgi:hypothetical protein
MRHLGELYNNGIGVEQDHEKAIEWYEKAADALDTYAMCSLGYIYYYGRGAECDYAKAYGYISQAAFLENVNATYKLGDMYYHGNYVEQDYDASFYWYSLAKAQEIDADRDYQGFLAASIAMRVGRALLYGEGTNVDLIAALFELRTAEALFYKQVLNGDEYSVDQLPKTQELIEAATKALDKEISK